MSNLNKTGVIEQVLDQKGVYVCMTKGISMEPMLTAGRDTVVIKKPEFPLKRYDIPVYRRGEDYVMHRIIKVTKNGYIIRGDNCAGLEYDITNADIVGVLAAFYHDGNYVEYGDAEYIRFAKQAMRTNRKRDFKRFLSSIKNKFN